MTCCEIAHESFGSRLGGSCVNLRVARKRGDSAAAENAAVN